SSLLLTLRPPPRSPLFPYTTLFRSSVVTVSLFAFLWAWSDFIFATTLDGGGDLQSITLGIYRYIGNNNQEWNAIMATAVVASTRSEEHTSELQSRGHLVCRLLLEKK